MAMVEVRIRRFMLRPVAHCRGGCHPGLMAKAFTINPGNDQIPMANDQWRCPSRGITCGSAPRAHHRWSFDRDT
jgi:hypothetical protein